MFKNFIKIAFRNFKRFKIYSLINLLGLSIGLACGVLILLFVLDELNYDQFHTKKERIYKVVTNNIDGGTMETNAWPVADIMEKDFSEVQHSLYTRRAPSSFMVNYQGKRYEHEIFYAEEEFFEMFSFNLIEGKPSTALAAPYSIVITEEMRNRYFGSELVVGKTLTLRDSIDFKITGVVEDIPQQSHIQFDMLVSFSTFVKETGFEYANGWGNFNVRNYILVEESISPSALQAKVKNLYMDGAAGKRFEEMGMNFEVQLVPLDELYLYSDIGNGFGPKGSIDQVYLVSGIGIFVILLACVNFINLTTARSVYRAKEVGLRKIVGSTRSSLMWQFIAESFVLTLMASGLVMLFIDLIIPVFNQLMGKQYVLSSLLQPNVMLSILAMIVVVTLLSGFYPAIVLSSYKPVNVLKGRMQTSSRGVKLRRGLVVFQFFVSGSLVLASLLVIDQLDYMRNQDLGFDKEQILVLDATRVPKSASHDAFKTQILNLANVQEVSFTNALPGRPGWQGQWAYPEKEDKENQVDTEYMAIDENYISTLGLDLLAGSNFNPNSPSQLEDGLIINETTVKAMGWNTPENAIGKDIVSPSGYPEGKVLGVVQDFHGEGLQEEIWPQVMDYTGNRFGRYYAIRFNTGQTSDLINDAENLWNEYLGDYTYEYYFLDEDFDRQYRSEEQLMQVFLIFSGLTVLIATIGLLGLVSFMVLSRTKEIGIRKILGADVFGLVKLLSKEFTVLVIMANLLAIPVIWYFGEQWLQNFAYRMNIDPTIFIVAFLVTLFIAIVTVSTQTIKAAISNPVDTLRNE